MNTNHRSRSLATAAATAVAAGAAVLALAPTTPTGAHTAATGPEPTLLVLDQRDGASHFVDVPPLGGESRPPSTGDQYISTNALLDPETGEKVGRTHSVCTTTQVVRRPLNAFANCFVVLRTGSGQIVAEASWSFTAQQQALAVTGGTGTYAGAHGTATWTSGTGERSRWEIALQP